MKRKIKLIDEEENEIKEKGDEEGIKLRKDLDNPSNKKAKDKNQKPDK